MRITRVKKFKKNRQKKVRKLLLLVFVMPCVLALLGYFIAAVIILPSMAG